MRVLMVSDVYFPRINGVSTSIETFRATLPDQGVSTCLVVPRYGAEPDLPGIRRVPSRTVLKDPEDRLAHYRALRRAVLEAAEDCDLIHIQTPFAAHYAGLHAARKLGKPVLATYHTLFEEYLQHYVPMLPAAWLRSLARRFSRSQCNDLDAVIVPSTAMAERLRGNGVTQPLHVLPTGLPDEVFRPGDRDAFRARHGIAPDRPVALFVGRVAHEKNIGFLLAAMENLRIAAPHLIASALAERLAERYATGSPVWVTVTYATELSPARELLALLRRRFDVRYALLRPFGPAGYLVLGAKAIGVSVHPVAAMKLVVNLPRAR